MSNEASVTLLIGTSSSRCSACNRNADPTEKAHDMVTMVGEGCGARFTHVANVYSEQGARVREMRPDLIFAGIDAPTPPLVAAPPVPPVVPDSEALSHDDRCESEFISGPNLYGPCGCADRSASGVVPDKPALAPYEYVPSDLLNEMFDAIAKSNAELWYRAAGAIRQSPVPAVTDDEAATQVMAAAIHDRYCGDREVHGESGCFGVTDADVVLAALRSAGFLIVHHTKET